MSYTRWVMIAVAVLLVSGCAAKQPTPADMMRAKAREGRQLADQWDRGQQLLTAGKKQVRKGERQQQRAQKQSDAAEKLMKAARENINKGTDKIAEGSRLIEESEKAYSEAPDTPLY